MFVCERLATPAGSFGQDIIGKLKNCMFGFSGLVNFPNREKFWKSMILCSDSNT